MGLLKEAVIEQSAAKVGIMGFQGSGKTTTALLLAIGLSKTYHNGAPIAMHDTEGGSDFLVPIAKIEGVRLLVHKSAAFKDMVTVLQEGERVGCCAFIQDTVTRTWAELEAALKRKKNITRLEFQHWSQLKETWRSQFVDRYLASPLHCIVNGRAGHDYDTFEDEEGKRSQERVGVKFKAESEFGYEPHLLIQMESRLLPNEERVGKKRRVRKMGGRTLHIAHVTKDRSRALQGVDFEFADINNYKAGDYKKVFEAFAPHWALLNPGKGTHVGLDVTTTSGELFESSGMSSGPGRYQRAKIACEEIEGVLTGIWPGSSEAAKRGKREAIKALFGTYSWTSVESRSVESLESAVGVLKLFTAELQRSAMSGGDVDAAIALLAMCVDRAREETLPPALPEVGVIAPEGVLPL